MITGIDVLEFVSLTVNEIYQMKKDILKPTQLLKLKATGEYVVVKELLPESDDMYSCFNKDKIIVVHYSELIDI